MKNALKKSASAARRIARVRAKIQGTESRPRLAVHRSLAHISAQVIDDRSGKTLVAASDLEVKATKKTKTEIAAEVGTLIAERATAKKITMVVFDRRDKKYHGRVRALADAARAAGLKF